MVGWLVGLVSTCSDPVRCFHDGMVRHGPFQMVTPRSLQVVCLSVPYTLAFGFNNDFRVLKEIFHAFQQKFILGNNLLDEKLSIPFKNGYAFG